MSLDTWVVSGRKIYPGNKLWVPAAALSVTALTLGDRKGMLIIKDLCHISARVIFKNKWRKKLRGNWLIQIYYRMK